MQKIGMVISGLKLRFDETHLHFTIKFGQCKRSHFSTVGIGI